MGTSASNLESSLKFIVMSHHNASLKTSQFVKLDEGVRESIEFHLQWMNAVQSGKSVEPVVNSHIQS